MKIAGAWLETSGTQALCRGLENAGYKALFVGGCVRNSLLGKPVSDIDISTDARPETVTDIAERAGFRVIPTGVDHGTVTVLAEGVALEVTTFRRDIETDGRHAVVVFATDVKDDASRRDFTMNALYADRHGTVVDPLGGLSDVLARRVRFVGEPTDRIREDFLRILRFFRFFAHFGDPSDGIDADGLSACAELAVGIETLSRERVGAEMRKLLSAPDPAPAVAAMQAAGVLGRVLPGADARALGLLVHLEKERPARWQRRLAVMGGHDHAEWLRLSRAEAAELETIYAGLGSLQTPAALGFVHGLTLATDCILARAAVFETPLPKDWEREAERGALANFPVSAADFMPDLQGPALGQKLAEVMQRWLDSDLSLTRQQLIG